jgi:hypothetical protein
MIRKKRRKKIGIWKSTGKRKKRRTKLPRWKGFDSFSCRMEESSHPDFEFEFMLLSLSRPTGSGLVLSTTIQVLPASPRQYGKCFERQSVNYPTTTLIMDFMVSLGITFLRTCDSGISSLTIPIPTLNLLGVSAFTSIKLFGFLSARHLKSSTPTMN